MQVTGAVVELGQEPLRSPPLYEKGNGHDVPPSDRKGINGLADVAHSTEQPATETASQRSAPASEAEVDLLQEFEARLPRNPNRKIDNKKSLTQMGFSNEEQRMLFKEIYERCGIEVMEDFDLDEEQARCS
jgi:hypothetical protein